MTFNTRHAIRTRSGSARSVGQDKAELLGRGRQAMEEPVEEEEELEDGEDEGEEELLSPADYYDQFNVEDLKDELRGRGIPVSGSKSELIDRLVEDDAT